LAEVSDPNARRALILSAEIDTAAAMIGLVRYSRDPHFIRNYMEIALRPYNSATDLLAIATLSPKVEQELRARLAPIKGWREAGGLGFPRFCGQ